MATLADVTRNRNILNIWSVVRRFTRGRWTEATIPTMPEIIAMLSLTELTEVTIQPGAQSPYLLQTLDKEVKHAVLVYPKGPTDAVLLQNPAVNPRIAYNEETGELTFAFDALPGTLTLIINDMLANDEATTQATLLNSPLQIQGYNPETAYTQGDIALYDDGVRKTLIVSNAPTQGEFDPTKWSILVTKDEYQPALALITQNLQNEIARATSQENQIAQNLSTETTRATAAEQGLRQDIASEVTRATAQEGQIAHDLSSEVSRATAAEQSLSQSLQQEITQRQAKDVASVQYNASTNSLQHNRTDGTAAVVAIPVADSNKNGLMSKQTYDQVQDIASIVSELVGKGTRRLTSAAINPEPEPTPDATWQASMNALWATASGGAAPVDGDTLISTNSATLWRLATYVASSNAWVYRGADTLSIASPTQLGIVLSTQAVDNTMENGGSVFVEQGTGAMVVNGWDNMTGRITSMEAFMNRQAGFATAAQGALADALDQTTVKTTGNQSINGVKNFIGSLQIDGVNISTLFSNKADLDNRNQNILANLYRGAEFALRHVIYGDILKLAHYTRFNDQQAIIGAMSQLRLTQPFEIVDSSALISDVLLQIQLDTKTIDVSAGLNLKGGLKFNGTDISSLFVDIANAQTITGAKTFVNYLTVAGGQTLASESMQFVAIDGQGGHINVAQGDLFIELFGAGAVLRIVPPTNFSSQVTFANSIRMYEQGTTDYADISYASGAVNISKDLHVEGTTNITTQKLQRLVLRTYNGESGRYYPIAQFVHPYTEQGANDAELLVFGRLGGYTMDETAIVTAIVGNRSGERGSFSVLGSPRSVNERVTLCMYRNSDDTSTVYLKVMGSYCRVDLNLQWMSSNYITYLFDENNYVTSPQGSLQWTMTDRRGTSVTLRSNGAASNDWSTSVYEGATPLKMITFSGRKSSGSHRIFSSISVEALMQHSGEFCVLSGDAQYLNVKNFYCRRTGVYGVNSTLEIGWKADGNSGWQSNTQYYWGTF